MNKLGLVFLIMLCAAMLGCAAGNDEFTSATDVQVRAEAGQAHALELQGGFVLNIPANTFEHTTTVLFSNRLFAELTVARFPTPVPAVGDLISGVVINTPADVVLHQNMQVVFALNIDSDAVAGGQYIVYRYDRYNGDWFPWGHTVATVDATTLLATATIPTADLRGFVGSLALFKTMTVDKLPVGANTVIRGTVTNSQGQPIATDVSVYLLVGALKHPASLLNGRIPAGGTVANTVDSAVDGTFTIQVPDNLIAQAINLEFGAEDVDYATQEHYDILAPAVPLNNATLMVVRFGENNVASRPVPAN